MKKFFIKRRNVIELVLGLLIVVAIMYLTGIGCPIKYVTGVSCAGCGMTRAFMSLLRGQFKLAFYYHPLVYLMPFIMVYFFVKDKLSGRIRKMLVFTICTAFVIVYIYRLINPSDLVVVFNPRDGLVGKLIKKVSGL